jgi:hypothetical protein
MLWWIIVAVAGFLILRSVLRAFSAPRYYGGAPGAPPPGTPPPGPGYGPGYGYGGFGGGSFWSGLLGGLGGAWLGNELFHGDGIAPTQAGQLPPDGSSLGGDPGAGSDSGGGGGDGGGGW